MGIEDHFVARKKDDEEFTKFEEHVNQRKAQRAEQIKLRQEREKEKRARDEEERKKKKKKTKNWHLFQIELLLKRRRTVTIKYLGTKKLKIYMLKWLLHK